jgi:pre-rRNA-processing protein IPI3
MEVKSFERIPAGAQSRESRDVPIALGGIGNVGLLDSLRVNAGVGGVGDGMGSRVVVGSAQGSGGQADTASQIAALESETKRLRASLERAIKVNDTMWKGVVQMKLAEDAP